MSVPTDYIRIEVPCVEGGFSMPRVRFRDRRCRSRAPVIQWVFQRHLEMILFNRFDGGTSGAIYKLLHRTGLARTAFHITRQSVDDGEATNEEFTALLDVFKQSHPSADVESLSRVRSVTLVPMATAAAMVRAYGLAPISMTFLRAFAQSVPRSWELEEQRAEHAERLEVDLVLEEELAAAPAELEQAETSFEEELMEMAIFASDRSDEQRMTQYALKHPSAELVRDFDTFAAYRTERFEARRSSNAVVMVTAEHDKQCVLRFFGYLELQKLVPEGTSMSLQLLTSEKVGEWAQAYAKWLQERQKLKCSSIANYLNGLAMVVSYVYESGGFELPEAVANAERTPLTLLLNLRNQAEKESKTDDMYVKRVGGFITWKEAQEARVRACGALFKADARHRRELLKDAVALSLLTLIPPDRVGVIRKLRVGHTLKRHEEARASTDPLLISWGIDLSQTRNAHKTARFYGPYAAKLPAPLWPLLTDYVGVLALEVGGDAAYLFHPKTLGVSRPMETSQWTTYIKGLFKTHHGKEVPPKALRSSFITWLRDSTDCPEVLKSAAHAMKHRVAMQESGTYDGRADDRLVEAAFAFNSNFTKQFGASTPMSSAPAPPIAPPAEPGLIGNVVARRSTQRAAEDEFCIFVAEVPWHASMALGKTLEFPKVPTRPHPAHFNVPDFGGEQRSITCWLKVRKTFRPNSTTLKGVRVIDEKEQSTEEEEEEEEEEQGAGRDSWRIERVEDVRRGKRRQLELYVKWSGVNEDGDPWPNDWIPASWATPEARRDGNKLEKQKALEEVTPTQTIAAPETTTTDAPPPVLAATNGQSELLASQKRASPCPSPTRKRMSSRTAPSPRPPTPLVTDGDEMSTHGFAVGQSVLARTIGPTGDKEWFRATITAFRPQFPPIVVEYTATADGDTTRLRLPQLLKGFVWRADVKMPREEA